MTNKIVLIIPADEAEGLRDFLATFAVPKPQSLVARSIQPPVLVPIRNVFTETYAALVNAFEGKGVQPACARCEGRMMPSEYVCPDCGPEP